MRVDLSNTIGVRLVDDSGALIRQLDVTSYQHSVDVDGYQGAIVGGKIISYPSPGTTALNELWDSYRQEMSKVIASDSLFGFLEELAGDVASTWDATEAK